MSHPDEVTHRSFSTSSARALHSPCTRGSLIAKDSAYSWAICVAAFIVQTITVGILNAFGVIFVALLEEFKVSKAQLSWIGSLAFGMSLGLGPLAGAVRMRFGARIAICSGGLICAIAMLTSSFVPNTVALFGTFSLLYAIGGSLIINSTTILAPDYFDKYVAITTGIIVAGASVGTLLFSCLSEIWVDSVGWRNTFRIYAGISVLTVIMGLLIRPVRRPPVPVITVTPPTPATPIPRLNLWQNRQYMIWVISITCSMFGYYIPYVHLISYAVDMGMTKDDGSVLIMILGGTSAFARLLFGKVLSFQFLKRRELHQLSMMITATATMMVTISTSMGGFVVYVIVLGLVDGCNVVLLPLLTRTYAGDCNVPIAWGILNGVSSITFILGPPVAGWLYDATGSYNEAFHVAGVPVLAGAAVLFFIPWAKRTTPKIPQQTLSGVDSENLSRDNFSRMDSTQLIVGLPLADHSSYTHSGMDLTTTNSSQARKYPDETTGLKDEPWGWRISQQCINVPSIEIDNTPHPPEVNELQSMEVTDGENIPTTGQSNDSFVFLDNIHDSHTDVLEKDDFIQATSPKPEKLSNSLSATNSPTLSPNATVVTLVELDDANETLVLEPTGEIVVQETRDTDTENLSLQETRQTEEDSGTAAVVIPDYVVEKLVELNENDQNKINEDTMVDTLVRLEDADEKHGDIVENTSVSDQPLENDTSLINTDYQAEKPQSGNRPFSRQPSESQCILPSSVVETLESLAQNPTDNGDNLQNEPTDNPQGVHTNNHPCVSGYQSKDQTQVLWASETENVPYSQEHPVSQSHINWPANNLTHPVFLSNDEQPHQNAPVWAESSTFSPDQNYENNVGQSQWTSSFADPATSAALSRTAVHAGSNYYQSSGTSYSPVEAENKGNIAPMVMTVPVLQRSTETDGWAIPPTNDHTVPETVRPWRQAASQTNIRDQQFCYTPGTVPSATAQWRKINMTQRAPNPNMFTDGAGQMAPAHYPGSSAHVYTSSSEAYTSSAQVCNASAQVYTSCAQSQNSSAQIPTSTLAYTSSAQIYTSAQAYTSSPPVYTSAQAYTSSPQVYTAPVVQQTPVLYNAGGNGNLSLNTWTTGDVPLIADNSIHIPTNIQADTNLAGLQQSNMDSWWKENNSPSTSNISSVHKSSSTDWRGSATVTDELHTVKEPSPQSLQFADGDKPKTPQSSPTDQSSTNPFLDKTGPFRSDSTEQVLCFNSESLEGADRLTSDPNTETLAAFDQFWQSRPSESQTDTEQKSTANDGAVG